MDSPGTLDSEIGGNEQLAALMHGAGFLREDGSVVLKVFARAVGRHSGRTYTHTYVRRWLNGMVPRDSETRDAITSALAERLGRPVGQAEVGFGRVQKVPADLGLSYPDTLSDGITAIAGLWQTTLTALPRC